MTRHDVMATARGVAMGVGALVLGIGLAGTAHAQKPARGSGADIKSRMESVMAKHETLVQTMKERFASCVGRNCDLIQEHMKKVESAHQRAKKQNDRFTAADYEDVNATRKGKCRGNKNCLETPEDLDVGPETETGMGEELADQLDEIDQGLEATNTLLAEPEAGPVALGVTRALAMGGVGFVPLYDYKADENYPAWLHVADNPRAIIPTAFAMSMAATTANIIASNVRNVCQQDIFGVNVSIACLPLDILAVALDGTSRLLNYNLSDATAWDAKGAYERAANLNANLGVVDGRVAEVGLKVGGTTAAVAVLDARAIALQQQIAATRRRLVVAQNQIIQLLMTPEGNRAVDARILTCDGSDGNPCPAVTIQCSPTTGLCTAR